MNNNSNISLNPLNVTIPGDIKPLACSTELKVKRNSRVVRDQRNQDKSVIFLNDKSVFDEFSCDKIFSGNEECSRFLTPVILNNEVEEDYCNISSRYLIKHTKPEFPLANIDVKSNLKDEKAPFRESNVVQPNSVDSSYFRRHSDPIIDSSYTISKTLSVLNKPNKNMNSLSVQESKLPCNTYIMEEDSSGDYDENNETVYMMKQMKDLDLNDTTLSGIDEVLGDVTIHGSLNMTQLATNLLMSDKKKAEQRLAGVVMTNIAVDEGTQLLSNKTCILWVGVPVQESDIKSFTLNLLSLSAKFVNIKIKKTNSCFFLTNQLGLNRTKDTKIYLQPNTTQKLYVSFHPTNSNYHSDVIIVNVLQRKYKISLFGYAEPSIVDLKGFVVTEDPYDANKKALMRLYPKNLGERIISMSVFNSGARTAFVAFFSKDTNVRFHPRMFLLIPKTRTEFDLKVTVKENMKYVDFFMISVDEELRRAARISFSELPVDEQYNMCNNIQIFSRLPEEKTIRQDDLPKFDYRPHLCRQISSSSWCCYLNLDSDDHQSAVTSDRWGNESASTIGMFTKSSITAPSILSNLEHLYAKNLCQNSTVSFITNTSQNLSAVVVLNDVNTFPPTPVSESNYIGVLIKNNHQFTVEWLISDLLASYHDSLLVGPSAANISCTSTSKAVDRCSPDSGSVYSLTSIPIYNSADSMEILLKSGSLAPNDSVVVPVRFTPVTTGKNECHCKMKIFTINDDDNVNDATYERELEFIGDGVRMHDRGDGGGVPYLVVDRRIEREVSITDVLAKEGKYGIKIQMRYKGRHGLLLFVSQPRPPFELKVPSVYLTESKSMLTVHMRSMMAASGGAGGGAGGVCVQAGRCYRDVLVFMDHDGNSTYCDLIVKVTM